MNLNTYRIVISWNLLSGKDRKGVISALPCSGAQVANLRQQKTLPGSGAQVTNLSSLSMTCAGRGNIVVSKQIV